LNNARDDPNMTERKSKEERKTVETKVVRFFMNKYFIAQEDM
jgi:hypothetical protein